jgi:hypothetical protein
MTTSVPLRVLRRKLYEGRTAELMSELPTFFSHGEPQKLCGATFDLYYNGDRIALGAGTGLLLQDAAGEDADETSLTDEEKDRAMMRLGYLLASSPVTLPLIDAIREFGIDENGTYTWSAICLRRSVLLIDLSGDFPDDKVVSGDDLGRDLAQRFTLYLQDDASSQHDDLKEIESAAGWMQDYLVNAWGFDLDINPKLD